MKCETSRDFTYIDNAIQMNLLAGTTNNLKAFGETFNVAVTMKYCYLAYSHYKWYLYD